IIVRTFPGQTDLPPIPINVYNYSATNTILQATASSSPFIDGFRSAFAGFPGNHRLEVTEKDMTERILELVSGGHLLTNGLIPLLICFFFYFF
ncbi:hypothetical protein, partial [Acinetobacter baumannii]|uniref:hypothetical protein n=1 Tax=Acinetobacter baumannii TaxID=470 RepID=UPI001C0688CE